MYRTGLRPFGPGKGCGEWFSSTDPSSRHCNQTGLSSKVLSLFGGVNGLSTQTPWLAEGVGVSLVVEPVAACPRSLQRRNRFCTATSLSPCRSCRSHPERCSDLLGVGRHVGWLGQCSDPCPGQRISHEAPLHRRRVRQKRRSAVRT